MVVVTGIKEAIKIAYKVGVIGFKVGKKTRSGQQWLSRHPKIARYGTIAASSAPIIYDLLNIDYSAIIPQKKPTRPYSKTRKYMELYSTKRRYETKCRPRNRYSSRRYY